MFTVQVECISLSKSAAGVLATFSVPRAESEVPSAPSPGPTAHPWQYTRDLTPAEAEGFEFGGTYTMTIG